GPLHQLVCWWKRRGQLREYNARNWRGGRAVEQCVQPGNRTRAHGAHARNLRLHASDLDPGTQHIALSAAAHRVHRRGDLLELTQPVERLLHDLDLTVSLIDFV